MSAYWKMLFVSGLMLMLSSCSTTTGACDPARGYASPSGLKSQTRYPNQRTDKTPTTLQAEVDFLLGRQLRGWSELDDLNKDRRTDVYDQLLGYTPNPFNANPGK